MSAFQPRGEPHLAYIVRSWPRLSQTFIVNEAVALERLGVRLTIFSLSHADDQHTHARAVGAPIRYLDAARRRRLLRRVAEHGRLLVTAPWRYITTLAFVIRRRDLTAGYSTTSRHGCFTDAVHIAAAHGSNDGGFAQIHAHFAHDPGLVGLLAHRLTGLPFSFTAHARDLYGIPKSSLVARARAAAAVVTCCRANVEYLQPLVDEDRLHLVHHGVDLEVFQPGSVPGQSPPLVLSVGRLVEKKGFDDLLRACALLRGEGRDFRCVIYGDGPLEEHLLALRDRLHLQGCVTLEGARSHQALAPIFRAADVFALTPLIASDGDRDGLPNVLVEAMACGVPVVTTRVGGITDLVRHDENGLLAEPGDVATVARHIGELIDNPARRAALGAAGRATVERDFDSSAAARHLASLFDAVRSQAS